MPKGRKVRRNPYPSADGEWLACHGIRKLPTGEIQLLTEKGVLSNPARRKSFINKVKKLFSANPKNLPYHKYYVDGNGYVTKSKAIEAAKNASVTYNDYRVIYIKDHNGKTVSAYKNGKKW